MARHLTSITERIDSMQTGLLRWLIVIAAVVVLHQSQASAATNVAVFNFQMKSSTPEWKWLAKGLSDRIATDFTQDPQLTVSARDRMQALAGELKWVPEMATSDWGKVGKIKRVLKIQYIVSGTYSVHEGKINLTGQIVQLNSNQEVARKTVSGPVEEVLKLQRRFSAELLSWFTKKPVSGILSRLPVWVRSIPAAKALYVGMDLYDQGRYAEAWAKFHQAGRHDTEFVETQYWLGKMYYFMGRYEHAQRAYDHFVYIDDSHPRLPDALREYVHTYEKLDTPPEAMLELYDGIAKRYPDVIIDGVKSYLATNRMDCRKWLALKSAQLLVEMGQHKVASQRADQFGWGTTGCEVSTYAMRIHNTLTGQTWIPKWADEWNVWSDGVVPFRTDAVNVNVKMGRRKQREWTVMRNGQKVVFDRSDRPTVCVQYLIAPAGYTFKTLTVIPRANRQDAKIVLKLSKDRASDIGSVERVGGDAGKPIVFTDLPATGWLRLETWIYDAQGNVDDALLLDTIRMQATYGKADSSGTVRVDCNSLSEFRVEIDGHYARTGPGLVGMLSPGVHKLTFRPVAAESPWGQRTVTVSGRPGKVIDAVVSLPWKKGLPWSRWSNGVLIGRDYPGHFSCLDRSIDRPALHADEKAIRTIWAYNDDLWTSTSLDGRTFTPPKRLTMPISSGWTEGSPELLCDESGKFMLFFDSDRNARHTDRVYASWSRDFIHWSAPAMILDTPLKHRTVAVDAHGQFVMAGVTSVGYEGKEISILYSNDGYRWEKNGSMPLPDVLELLDMHVSQTRDGVYELYLSTNNIGGIARSNPQTRLWVCCSKDGRQWSRPKLVGRIPKVERLDISVVYIGQETILTCFEASTKRSFLERCYYNESYHKGARKTLEARLDGFYSYMTKRPKRKSMIVSKAPAWFLGKCQLSMFRKTIAGQWTESPHTDNVIQGIGTMAYHPKWGYLMSWMTPKGDFVFPKPKAGPFLIRGRDISAFFKSRPASKVRR